MKFIPQPYRINLRKTELSQLRKNKFLHTTHNLIWYVIVTTGKAISSFLVFKIVFVRKIEEIMLLLYTTK